MRQFSNWRTRLAAAVASVWLLAAPGIAAGDAATAPASLQPYTARYQVSYRGLNGGEIESSFKRGAAAGQWQYETRVFPTLLARVAISSQAHELSVIQADAAGIRPLSFNFDDGSASAAKDVRLHYDWNDLSVTGSFEGKPVSLAITPGTQDTSSVQAAMILERLAGRKPQGFKIITGGKLREYRYWPEGTQQVMTPYGQLEAEIWASQRTGSNRVTKTWHAPSLGYVPVQAVQYRKGNPEVQMKLVKLTRGEGK
jgi:Protein of unknown function (DUF3108)